ncbi:MAG TPA: 16S rRNA (adenine(1518)-N(6)/adenine(1519)-N(6))-dimethyltransferase RsmA [Solirubrobacteraceae bacterium]|nr:16S rRNA (adenine(1518)-N(6)/adenine(1519)-N(6))-dimethyltransferase RsmA [Solirubrobacteraceae bacterium]
MSTHTEGAPKGTAKGHAASRASRRSRELGQNFLRDPNILGVIGREAELSAEDVVLEVGGGEGVLSAYLAPCVSRVHVVEFDERLRGVLERGVAEFDNVSLWWGDAMRVDLAAMQPTPTKMVANLPYGIAAGVILRTIEELEEMALWLVMVQREVGERLAAAPGSGVYGVSSVLAQLAGEVKVVRAIPRTVFSPVPNVDSVLVKIVRTGAAPTPAVRKLVAGAFAHRRKALARSLVLSGTHRTREDIRAGLVELGHPADERAERLAPAEFVELAKVLGL